MFICFQTSIQQKYLRQLQVKLGMPSGQTLMLYVKLLSIANMFTHTAALLTVINVKYTTFLDQPKRNSIVYSRDNKRIYLRRAGDQLSYLQALHLLTCFLRSNLFISTFMTMYWTWSTQYMKSSRRICVE